MPQTVEEYANRIQERIFEMVEERKRLLDAVNHPEAIVFYDWAEAYEDDAAPMCVYVGDIASTKYGDQGKVIKVDKPNNSITIKKVNGEEEEFSIDRVSCSGPPPLFTKD